MRVCVSAFCSSLRPSAFRAGESARSKARANQLATGYAGCTCAGWDAGKVNGWGRHPESELPHRQPRSQHSFPGTLRGCSSPLCVRRSFLFLRPPAWSKSGHEAPARTTTRVRRARRCPLGLCAPAPQQTRLAFSHFNPFSSFKSVLRIFGFWK